MGRIPIQMSTVAGLPSPQGHPSAKKARLCWDGVADASDPVQVECLEGVAGAATEAEKPKQSASASVLDELCWGASGQSLLGTTHGAVPVLPNNQTPSGPDLSGTQEAAQLMRANTAKSSLDLSLTAAPRSPSIPMEVVSTPSPRKGRRTPSPERVATLRVDGPPSQAAPNFGEQEADRQEGQHQEAAAVSQSQDPIQKIKRKHMGNTHI